MYNLHFVSIVLNSTGSVRDGDVPVPGAHHPVATRSHVARGDRGNHLLPQARFHQAGRRTGNGNVLALEVRCFKKYVTVTFYALKLSLYEHKINIKST